MAVEQFSTALGDGDAAGVIWSVAGGDAQSGAGLISGLGQYSPPTYLTADSVQVIVTATLKSHPSAIATARVTITPGFSRPLAPENTALGEHGTISFTGVIAEAGGTTGIEYALSKLPSGSSGGEGLLGRTNCVRSKNTFTYCTVTYSAPATVSFNSSTYVVANVSKSFSHQSAEVLLNNAGINSNPTVHQSQSAMPILLGTSSSNNEDYDTHGNQIFDCCGGTLGALIQSGNGRQYLLSCNHVLARADEARNGDHIIQPGLIDSNCTPNGDGPGTELIGFLSTWLPLSSRSTNVDAAIAEVNSGAVDGSGAIMELGRPLANGTLAAAPPGTSSTAGKGENASVGMVVAKSGRTTGLTCASISAINADVQVSYFKNCAETEPYLTKIFTNQIEIEGTEFSDAGDSGSLVVDASNAEPVGLLFAGGVTSSGVNEAVANPAQAVLAELGAQEGTSYTFVGAADHPLSCLNYGSSRSAAAQAITLTDAQISAAEQALTQARLLVNPSAGILGVAIGRSSDSASEATVILYVDQSMKVDVPQLVNGVRTEVVRTTAQAVATGSAPQFPAQSNALPPLAPSVLNKAIAVKQQIAQSMMKQNPAFFGVGVGQSLDNPQEASLVVYVDRRQAPASLPLTISGLRVRYIFMDRLHVTRSYLTGQTRAQSICMAHPAARRPRILAPMGLRRLLGFSNF